MYCFLNFGRTLIPECGIHCSLLVFWGSTNSNNIATYNNNIVNLYIYIYIHNYINIHTHINKYIYKYIYIYIYTYMLDINTWTYIYIYIYILIHTSRYIDIVDMYICVLIHYYEYGTAYSVRTVLRTKYYSSAHDCSWTGSKKGWAARAQSIAINRQSI